MNIGKAIMSALLLSVLMVSLSACDQQGPVEEAGEKVDETVEETGEAIEDATDNE